jgi:hypothetical protein
MQVLHISALSERLVATMLPQRRDWTADLQADLGCIKTTVEERRAKGPSSAMTALCR